MQLRRARRAVAGLLVVTGAGAGCASASAPAATHPVPAAGHPTPAAAQPTPAAAHLKPSVSPSPVVRATRGGPKAAAQAESRRLLASVTVPPGSTSVPTAPTPRLRQGAEQPVSANLVDATAWWTVPLTQTDALAWLSAHRPAGLTDDGSGGGGTGGDAFLIDGESATTAYQAPELVLLVVPFGAHGSALRADTQLVWIPERSPAEHAPTGAGTTVTVAYRRTITGPWLGQRRMAGTVARKVAVAFDAMPVRPPGVSSCGAGTTFSLRLAFPAGLVATTTGVCDAVSVIVHGHPQPPLNGSSELEQLLLADLHLPPNAPYQR